MPNVTVSLPPTFDVQSIHKRRPLRCHKTFHAKVLARSQRQPAPQRAYFVQPTEPRRAPITTNKRESSSQSTGAAATNTRESCSRSTGAAATSNLHQAYTVSTALHNIKEKANACQRPLNPAGFRLQLCRKDLLPEPSFCGVDGASIRIFLLCLVRCNSAYQDDRHGAEELLGLGVIQYASFVVPASTFQGEASDESTIPVGISSNVNQPVSAVAIIHTYTPNSGKLMFHTSIVQW